MEQPSLTLEAHVKGFDSIRCDATRKPKAKADQILGNSETETATARRISLGSTGLTSSQQQVASSLEMTLDQISAVHGGTDGSIESWKTQFSHSGSKSGGRETIKN